MPHFIWNYPVMLALLGIKHGPDESTIHYSTRAMIKVLKKLTENKVIKKKMTRKGLIIMTIVFTNVNKRRN